MIKINGVIDRVIFRNDDNGYTVAVMNSEGDDIIIVGSSIMELKENMDYELAGDFTVHKKYGEQFAFEEIKVMKPESESGIIKYLASGVLPHVGKKTAKRIYKEFGEKSIEIIENNPEELLVIEGIGKKKLSKIKEAVLEGKDLRDLMVFLTKYDIGTNIALRIYKQYNVKAIEIITQNPYKLTEDIRGIGFKKADNIARMMGFEEDSSFRKQAALKFILSQASMEGHTFLPKDELLKRTGGMLKMNSEEFEDELYKLAMDEKFYIEKREDEVNCYYAPFLKAENFVVGKITELNKFQFDNIPDIDKELNRIEKDQDIKFAEKQQLAVKESVKSGILVITGGPGTGKTTTLKAIIDVFESMDKKVYLAAPTGRAAKRMKEATGREASTLHKLLEIGFSEEEDYSYGYEEETTLECDVLIVDEMSMVDLLLMETLLKSIKNGTRLILVGDKDQLPSVGAGNVLSDLIESSVINVVNLDEIFRQSESSMIIKNAHLINKGMRPEFKKDSDFFFIYEEDEERVLEIIKDLVNRRLPDYYGFSPLEIQVLAPMKKGITGVNNLNKNLQKTLNEKKNSRSEINVGENIFRINDKVMQIKNNYDLTYKIDSEFYEKEGEGVFNGDIGFITDVDKEEREVTILYDDIKKVKYEYQDLDELKLAYATTIHKSQGSEFRCVVIPMTFAPYILLTRNLLYTAITRAKELVVLVGEYKYMDLMIKNNRISKRYSNLAKKLREINLL